jgi:hypothetical protein
MHCKNTDTDFCMHSVSKDTAQRKEENSGEKEVTTRIHGGA